MQNNIDQIPVISKLTTKGHLCATMYNTHHVYNPENVDRPRGRKVSFNTASTCNHCGGVSNLTFEIGLSQTIKWQGEVP